MRLNRSILPNNFSDAPLRDLVKGRPKYLTALEQAGISRFSDLALLIPNHVYQLTFSESFREAIDGQWFASSGAVHRTWSYPSRGKFNVRIQVTDESGETIDLCWFNCSFGQKEQLKSKESIQFYGKVSDYQGRPQIVAPKSGRPNLGELIAQYPLIKDCPERHLRKLVSLIPASWWDQLPESLAPELIKAKQFPRLGRALYAAHGLATLKQFQAASRRLHYQSLFADQLELHKRKQERLATETPIIRAKRRPHDDLSFALTRDQTEALDSILSDLAQGHPMKRLLQGDVGTGKTAVALLSTIAVTENSDAQVAVMCPTEFLANQVYREFQALLGDTVGLITSQTKPNLETVSKGELRVLVGTHALIQDKLIIPNLRYIIIDEQHRFGVGQRDLLIEKGVDPHVLLMSATPIPQTLRLAQLGDTDVSNLRERPPGRAKLSSKVIENHHFENYLRFVHTRLSLGEKVYVVAPSIDSNEMESTHNLGKLYRSWFPSIEIASVHGAQDPAERSSQMQSFTQGDTQILIATTLIEVGINCPQATVMAIHSPDRFGLSTLHQLRGRVGRGQLPGFCFFVTQHKFSKEVQSRLQYLASTYDGHEIAQEDLRLRGQGDLVGEEQSGQALASHPDALALIAEIQSDLINYHM